MVVPRCACLSTSGRRQVYKLAPSWRRGASAPQTRMPRLASLDLAGVAKFLGSAECRSVALLTGAGMSSGAGIPDFRSPGVARSADTYDPGPLPKAQGS